MSVLGVHGLYCIDNVTIDENCRQWHCNWQKCIILYAGYLNDHKIQDNILLPGAAMFEMCNAASASLKMTSESSILHSINLSSPCNLGDSGSNVHRNPKVLTCCTTPTMNQMEVKSRDMNGPLEQHSKLHLHGWCGWLASCSPHSCSSHSTNGNVESLLSRVKRASLLTKPEQSNLHSSHEILQLPSFSNWLQTSGPYNEVPNEVLGKSEGQNSRTSVAIVVDTLAATCIQPGAYVVHPATLDAATHTAAALAAIPTHDSNPSKPSCFMHVALYWIFFTGSRHAKASKLHALEHSHVGVTRIPARVDAIHLRMVQKHSWCQGSIVKIELGGSIVTSFMLPKPNDGPTTSISGLHAKVRQFQHFRATCTNPRARRLLIWVQNI